jgi:hypothetical protein
MTALVALAGMLIALLSPAHHLAPASALVDPVDVTVASARHSTVLGRHFTFVSRFANPGPAPTDPLIAHLNVASLTSDVYVDPEDWSSQRTVEVPPLRPGSATSLSWDLQAVNAGRFAVYVVVLPKGSLAGGIPLVVSSPMQVDVAGRRTLNLGGTLPVVVAIPAALGLLALSVRRRMRRTD